MKNTCTKMLALAFFCGLFQSCSKDEQIVDKLDTIEVKSGRLSFENQAHFDLVFDELMKNQESDYLNSWESQHKGFTSMKSAYDNLTDVDFEKIAQQNSLKGYENVLQIRVENGEKEAAAVTDHPIMARIFNHEGLLLIGKDAFKLQKDRLIKIDSYNEEKIQKALNSPDENSNYLKIESKRITEESKDLSASRVLDLERSCTTTYDTRYRFKGIFALIGTVSVNPSGDWTADFSGRFSSIIWIAQHRKRTAFIWHNDKTTELRLNGTVAYLDDNGGFFPGTLTEIVGYNINEIASAHGWGGNYRATASVTSSGIGTDGSFHGCTETR
ncbi:hypothetical protein DSL64_16015 [Dyadobacter luteus]|uniref:DUF4848 domain-containing protein n=1 Tax=Dyadobacter luteus TaxID=2259619 RepID=A0A3D8YAJ0_9BACT|nr:hypothetical protein [Dyadobacter luteus]REA60177.1 hypothetical protein DSL64_16015 [Dyadobacter luteus]